MNGRPQLDGPGSPSLDHTRLYTSSFPRQRSRVLGRVIVLRSALWQNCLQRAGAGMAGGSQRREC